MLKDMKSLKNIFRHILKMIFLCRVAVDYKESKERGYDRSAVAESQLLYLNMALMHCRAEADLLIDFGSACLSAIQTICR